MFNMPQGVYLSKKSLSALGKRHPKSQFTSEEDVKLTSIVNSVGDKNWELVSKMMGNRNPRQCMERWSKYLSPSINRSPFTPEEDNLLIKKHAELGAKWVKISKFFENRTDAALKNRWNVIQRRERTTKQSSSGQSSFQSPVPKCTAEPMQTVKQQQKPIQLQPIPIQQQFNVVDEQAEPSQLDFDVDFCSLFFEPEFQF